jgi:hypothetical protein
MKKSKRSIFSGLIQYLNKFDCDQEISRKNLVKELGRGHSVDIYRNYFRQAGYLATIKRGIYKRVYHIPTDLTTRELLKIAYTGQEIRVEEKK